MGKIIAAEHKNMHFSLIIVCIYALLPRMTVTTGKYAEDFLFHTRPFFVYGITFLLVVFILLQAKQLLPAKMKTVHVIISAYSLYFVVSGIQLLIIAFA